MRASWLQQRDASESFPGCSWRWGTFKPHMDKNRWASVSLQPCTGASLGAPPCWRRRRMNQARPTLAPPPPPCGVCPASLTERIYLSQGNWTWLPGSPSTQVSLEERLTWLACVDHNAQIMVIQAFQLDPESDPFLKPPNEKWSAHSNKLTGTCAGTLS